MGETTARVGAGPPNGHGLAVKGKQHGLFGEESEADELRKDKLIKGVYKFGEVTSAMQKEIRRGDERAAMFWGQLLFEASPYYGWKRVLVTAAEDIGFGSPETVNQVINLAIAWRLAKERSYFVTGHHFSMAIMLLCRAPKSTEVEDLQTLTMERIKAGERLPILEEHRDAHTQAGKEAGKGWADWYADRRDVFGIPVNLYLEEIWAMHPEWSPDQATGNKACDGE